MAKVKNPFIVSGRIEPQYFCDRKAETAALFQKLGNGNNIVLISPRRMGKTGLVRYCYDNLFGDKDYYLFFIDILHTTGLQEMTYQLGRKIYETLIPRGRKVLNTFLKALRSVSAQFGYDAVRNTPTFNLSLGDISQPELTLEEIFRYLEQADRPCIVTIDEFQQIAKYPEKNVEALLRTFIQQSGNCRFIFSGSEYHVMQEMFLSESHPFYDSADIMELKPIGKDVYTQFVRQWMQRYSKGISEQLVGKVYALFRGNTYGMQRTFNEIFQITDADSRCDLNTVVEAINNIVNAKEPLFNELLSNINEKTKALLYAIAQEGEAEKITSAEFLRKHRLSSASSVQNAAKQLISKGVVTKIGGRYMITEQFFDIWINRLYGSHSLQEQLQAL